MKQKYFLRTALIIFINFSTYGQDDFETWPLSFDTSDSGISISQESSIVYQGKYSASVQVNTSTQGNTDWRKNINLTSGVTYTVSFKIYHTEGNVKARVYAGEYRNYSDKGSTGSWQTLTYDFTPTSTDTYDIGLRFYDQTGFDGSEVVYVDDFKVSVNWTGSSSSDWASVNNWNGGSLPSSIDNIFIPSGLSNYPTATSAVTVNSVIMESGTSLIAGSTFTGSVTYNRNIPTTQWYLISSPVGGQDIDAFVASEGLDSGTENNVGLSDYNNATPAWTYYQNGASGTGNFTSGDGRAIKLASQGDISFTGTIISSDVTVAMTSNSNGFNLVGNPYPSYVAGNENADGTNNILTINSANLTENTLWFWNQSTDSYNQINQASAAFQIAPAQGFFVSATGSVNLSITEAMQSHQGTDNFQRLTTRPEIELSLSNGTATRNADIYYLEGTTTGWDNGYDSSIFGGVANEFAIYTHSVSNGSGRNLGIQSLPPNNYENMIIPVGINAEAGTPITIDAASNNFPTAINIYLEDKQDNSFTLLEADSNFSFTPENNLDGIGRFYLHTTSGVLNANDFATNNNISIYTSSNDNLRITGVQKGTAAVRLYNILGKEVLNTSFVGSGVNNIKVNDIPIGIYIVKLTTENGTLNRKIIIQY